MCSGCIKNPLSLIQHLYVRIVFRCTSPGLCTVRPTGGEGSRTAGRHCEGPRLRTPTYRYSRGVDRTNRRSFEDRRRIGVLWPTTPETSRTLCFEEVPVVGFRSVQRSSKGPKHFQRSLSDEDLLVYGPFGTVEHHEYAYSGEVDSISGRKVRPDGRPKSQTPIGERGKESD